ncbi:hypothetical protein [Ruminococcus flavefaciens]|uniref:Uncharacterized protein n=1 Tax=Ruminococcus flavefaciens TaxID=1265 RepID=A0A1M7IX22_RUMFL|nr:hypothetical protein [Ruminococcus flavefaciens]SHM45354.1 hypothetical protein SAMN04487860_1052 [Ruminococcus flavefaciens]
MLKHEEMIENVHRRIAQYEEEKKMKNSKLKKLFSANNNKTEAPKTNEDEYTEVVSGTENISSSSNTMRIVSSLAAAAVLVTGIGATGFLLHKNKANKSALPEEEVIYTESTESDNIVDSGAVSPFVDFRQEYFNLWLLTETEYSDDYSDETYDKLAVFLNNFNWGEGTDIEEKDIPDFHNFEGNDNARTYGISWQKGDIWYYVYVTEYGKAYYTAEKCQPDGNNYYYPIIESSVYDIDYEAFDKGVQDIWNSNIPDTSQYLSKREQKYLTKGEFQNGMVERCKEYNSDEVISEGGKSFKALQGFLRDDFVGMLQHPVNDISYDGNDKLYNVACYYKTSDTTTRRLTYYIGSNGSVSLCEYELTESNNIPTGYTNYYIDINEFETVLNDIASGKYDDKYSFEEKTTTTTVTTSATTTVTTTVTTTEQAPPPEETDEPAPEKTEEEKEKELLDTAYKSIIGNYLYYNTMNNDGFEHMTDEGRIDFKNVINYMVYEAEHLSVERELGEIIDEQDAIEKARNVLLNEKGQEYMDWLEKEPHHDPEVEYYRERPAIIADYYDEFDIWVVRPTAPSWKRTDGQGPYIVALSEGASTKLFIRGHDGKILGCLLHY